MTALRAQVSRRLAASSPYEVWNAFVNFLGSEPIELFTPEQRVAALAFRYESEVQNGGHLQYFSNCGVGEATQAVDALRQLGAPGHAAVLASAVASLPADPDPSPVSVDEYVSMALEDPHGRWDRAFHELNPPLIAVLEAYLDSHFSAFIAFDDDGA
jgi:hypothetical protein